MHGSKVAIGIDLGTTKCCVGVVRDGRVEIVENERGSKTTPSYVAFTDTERLVGDDAKDQVALNPTNTVFGVKGLIGRNYEQALIHCQENHLPFSVDNIEGKPKIRVKYLGEDESLAPEQISAMLLSKMKKLAESHLGYKVTDAVISVPAYFNNAQRLATKAAAEIAGLRVLRLINEPTAAALAFKVSRTTVKKETVVILDIGGGTFDAAVATINKSCVEVVGVQGDCHFGGQCFDNFMMNHFVDEFSRRHGSNLRENKKSMERLRLACSKIKHNLSLLPKARYSVECILGKIDFDVEMTRTAFEDLSSKFIKEKMRSVLTLLPSKSVSRADCVVAVGGSVRVPKIESLIMNYFEKKLTKTINIDEAVAYGAAFLAAQLSGDNALRDVQVLDTAPHIIDVIPTWEKFESLIPRSEKNKILISRSLALRPSISKDVFVNGATTLFEFVFYADHQKTEYNKVGTISFSDPHNHSEKARLVPIQYKLDEDGIFRAVISNQSTESNRTHHLVTLKLETVHDIQRMREAEEQFEKQQQSRLKQAQALSDLEHMCFELKQNCKERSELMRGNSAEAMRVCDDVLVCLDATPDATVAELLQYKEALMKFMP